MRRARTPSAASTIVLKLPENSYLQVVERQRFNPTDVSVSAQMERIKAANPQALIAWSTGAPIATVFKGILAAGLNVAVGTTNGNQTYAQMAQYKDFLPKELFIPTSVFLPHEGMFRLDAQGREQQQKLYAAFAAANLKPDSMTVLAWDPANIVVDHAAAHRNQGDGGAGQGIHRQPNEPSGHQRHLRFQIRAPARLDGQECAGHALGRRCRHLGRRSARRRERHCQIERRVYKLSAIFQIVIGGLLQGGVFAIVALGFSLVFRVTNVVNLSQGAFCVLGAMGMYYFQVVFGWPVLPSRQSRRSSRRRLSPLLVGSRHLRTCGDAAADQQHLGADRRAAHLPYRSDAGGLGQPALFAAAILRRGAVGGRRADGFRRQGVWLAAVSAVMITGLWLLLHKTTLGRALRACAENPVRRPFDGHRSAAHDAAELRPRRLHRCGGRRPGRADHVAAIRLRAIFHDHGFYRRCHRRHGQFRRRDRRRSPARRRRTVRRILCVVLVRQYAGVVASGARSDCAAGRFVSERPTTPQRSPRRSADPSRRDPAERRARRDFRRRADRAAGAVAALAAARRRAGVARHFAHSVHRGARARRADGVCGTSQSRSCRFHGGRRLCGGDPRDFV